MSSPTYRFVQGRFGLLYATIFLVIGIRIPYFPVWLEARGLDAVDIGIVLMVTSLVSTLAQPIGASIADRRGDRRGMIIWLTVAGTLGLAALGPAHGFWPILIIVALWSCTFPVVMPLCESITVAVAYERKLDYGRFRLWGSITFIIAAVGVGPLSAGRSPDLILWLIVAALGLTSLATLLIPSDPRAAKARPKGRRTFGLVYNLMRHPTFAAFLLGIGLIQGSHAVFLGFATLHWRSLDFSGLQIGALWGASVIAEVGIFAFSNRVVGWLGPVRLMALAGVAGVIRWGLSGFVTDFAILLPLHVLNGLTYGTAHLGAIHFIVRAVPAEAAATGQSLYSAISMGLVLGLAIFAAGFLYEAYGTASYFAMAALSTLGLVFIGVLLRRWKGEELPV